MRTVIVGMGEVGSALQQVLGSTYEVHAKDIGLAVVPAGIDIMHACIRYSDKFIDIVRDYDRSYSPKLINICTTCPPGTTEQIGPHAVHSTTRGLHPNLASGLRTITKHIGGPQSEAVAEYFRAAGVPCETHRLAKTTELLHLLNNCHYGAELLWAAEAASICREFGVDYTEYMRYTQTHNAGFVALDQPSKVRSVLTPPGDRIGGHCVQQAAKMLGPLVRGKKDQIELLAKYGDAK